jgi:hypothetical protein
MKAKIYTLVLVAIGMTSLALAQVGSNLMLRMATPQAVSVNIDNQNYGSSVSIFNAYNLMPGVHRIQVFNVPGNGIGNGYGYNHPPCGLPVLLFDGWVNFPASSLVNAYLDPYNQFSILGIQPNMPVQGPVYGGPIGIIGMPALDFDRLKSSITSKSFESDRLAVAKQAVNTNQMSSQQMFELVNLMTYESTKLELAKYGYARVADRNNYHLVTNAFTYSSSTTQLTDFMNGNGH